MSNPNLTQMFQEGKSEAELHMEKVIQESLSKQTAAVEETVAEEVPTGGGIIIDTPKEEPKKEGIKVGSIPAHVLEGVEDLMKELDEDIENAKMIAEEKSKEAAEELHEEDEEETEEFNQDQYDKAIVIIDKLGMGTVNFTDEERAKMERVKKIEVQEVEVISLETLKVKRDKKQSIDKVLKAKKNVGGTSNVVLVGSGYTAVMGKCSLFELSNLFLDKDNLVETQLSKWSFIYSKMVDSSVKFKSFDHFIKSTAVSDYNTFIFGILCASYPDVDEIGLKCTDINCPGKVTGTKNGQEVRSKEYEFKYDIRSIIRAERMTEGLLEKIKEVVDNSYVEADAARVHQNAPVSVVKRYRLPASGYVIEGGIESVHDFIYNAARVSDNLEDEKYRQSLTTATMIRKLYIPDEDGEYFEFEDKLDIAKALYELYDEADIKAVIKQNAELSKDLVIEYGFAEVTCPYCKHVTPFVPVDPDDILFHKYRQATMTE